MSQQDSSFPMIHVGASKETVLAARQSIMDILEFEADRETTIEALKTFAHICNVNNTTISGNTLYHSPPQQSADQKAEKPGGWTTFFKKMPKKPAKKKAKRS